MKSLFNVIYNTMINESLLDDEETLLNRVEVDELRKILEDKIVKWFRIHGWTGLGGPKSYGGLLNHEKVKIVYLFRDWNLVSNLDLNDIMDNLDKYGLVYERSGSIYTLKVAKFGDRVRSMWDNWVYKDFDKNERLKLSDVL